MIVMMTNDLSSSLSHAFCLQSSPGVMTWSLLATSSCTSTWGHSRGRASRLPQRDRNMNGSARRKCPHPLKFFAKDTHVSEAHRAPLRTTHTSEIILRCIVFSQYEIEC